MKKDRAPGPFVERIPDGDNRPRLVCEECGFIRYDNPKIVVGAVCTWEGRVLLCRRGIEPRLGYWTIPAGFMEVAESTRDGAAREVLEEACARVRMGSLIGIYEIPQISQVHMLYRAAMVDGGYGPGDETTEADLFDWDTIPWDDLAFPSVAWALRHADDDGPPKFFTTEDPSFGRG